ncbi:signal transduction histidine kinase [Asanoa ferruginea]|uniref:histidine kinase n=1 Tax=Asanoa ferruginea TaxID=53367 RepID=A0A3D9ZW63_9ACTN|nr:histidine kinase [Asanoa ferruginea]REG00855.1 signal transduction histidine kinase [Asanoa ferruginea]GIF47270.1 two-component sensor histidine kinase [Asanoa ferruginea]
MSPPTRSRSAFLLRLVPTALAVFYLPLADQPGNPVDGWAWAFALGAAALFAFGRRIPLTMVLCLSGLLVITDRIGTHADVVVILATFAALIDLALHRDRRWIAAGVLAAAVGLFVNFVDVPLAPLQPPFFFVVTGVIASLLGAPILLGLHLKAARLATAEAQQRAVELEQRRESEKAMVRATERTAIARELHDIVVHHVASIVLRVGVARHLDPDADPETAAALDDVHATGTAALADLRRLVAVLRDPATLDEEAHAPLLLDPADLPDLLHQAVARSRNAGLSLDASVDPGVAGLDAVRGLALLRVVQEGLTNVLKHAGPHASATVTVAATADGAVRIDIFDDGTAAKRHPPTGGHGLLGLRERIHLLGGEFEAGPGLGLAGWRIQAVLPVTAMAAGPA